jgi:hypothetical protein
MKKEGMTMKPIPQLDFGFRDAENYRRKENKELLNKLFVRTQELDKLCEPNVFFLIGEKGTGKTAYAVFLSNMEYHDNVASNRFIRETEYQRFVALREQKHLTLTDYTHIWKVIIYLLLAQQIREKSGFNQIFGFQRFVELGKAIDEYYNSAFAPEIIQAMQFAEEANVTAEIIAKYLKAGGYEKSVVSFSESNFQINLMYIERQFEDAFRALKLPKNHILFIDGIDIRPQNIDYEVYIDCIKGLANAVWAINNDIFANIKDSKGRLRTVLLVRPDIFNILDLQNQNSKIRDNAVILNWLTTYTEYRHSPLFLMTDRLLGYQQETSIPEGAAWDYYFPYDAVNVMSYQRSPSSFISILRFSLYRPRNVITILSIHKENFIEQGRNPNDVFKWTDFTDPAFTRKYSDYLLGEVKDHISFYYDQKDYESFLKFFQFLNGKNEFNYETFCEAFKQFIKFLKRNKLTIPTFCDTPDNFLQFLYDLNILSYIVYTQDRPFFGWCNRERSLSNIAPKVRTHVFYKIHYGLMKSLDLGKKFFVDTDYSWSDDE